MAKTNSSTTVTIVGGGPVGLFLAICLLKKGIPCRVLEKRQNPVPDSRSLGIHPVSLELFDELNITAPFLEKGVKIHRGIALNESKKLGEISFDRFPSNHPYILACPQFYTEQILRNELQKLDADALIKGAQFQSFDESSEEVITTFKIDDSIQQISSKFLIGCDGKNSSVRHQASIRFVGKKYQDTYIMGDFADTTGFGSDAAVFLPNEGLIESFPLPNGMRRWVVKTPSYISSPTHRDLALLVKQRVNYNLYDVKSTMLSSFGVQHYVAEPFVKNRIIVAGDAAHVVSPIGGQGMNLGWMGARELAKSIAHAIKNNNSDYHFTNYGIHHKKKIKKAARRAEMNMWLGRKSPLPFLRNILVKGMLSWPFKIKTEQLFTMRKL